MYQRGSVTLGYVPYSTPACDKKFTYLPRFSRRTASTIVTCGSVVTINFVTTLRRYKVRIPRGISIIKVSSVPVDKVIGPALSAVRVSHTAVKGVTISRLIDQLHKKGLRQLLGPVVLSSHFVAHNDAKPQQS